METSPDITAEAIDSFYVKLKVEAEGAGYHLNPDEYFAKDLVKGLLVNTARYGYQSCPCHLRPATNPKIWILYAHVIIVTRIWWSSMPAIALFMFQGPQ